MRDRKHVHEREDVRSCEGQGRVMDDKEEEYGRGGKGRKEKGSYVSEEKEEYDS